jgi:hypothetical protein
LYSIGRVAQFSRQSPIRKLCRKSGIQVVHLAKNRHTWQHWVEVHLFLLTYTRGFHDKSAMPNQRPTIQRMMIRRYDESAQRQLGAKTNQRNDKSALMSNNQNIKYQHSAQNREARFLASQSASKLQVL